MSSKFLPLGGILTLGLSTMACDELVEPPNKGRSELIVPPTKGRIDRGALQSGVTVTLVDELGTVQVPFARPVPVADDADIEAELAGATTLVIRDKSSGVTTDLASGALVEFPPAGPGEWSWELNGARDEATMTFFNVHPTGATLDPSAVYSASLSIAKNLYIKEEPVFVLRVKVVEP